MVLLFVKACPSGYTSLYLRASRWKIDNKTGLLPVSRTVEQVPFGGWLQSPFGVKAEQTNPFCEHFIKHLWELGCHLGAKTEKSIVQTWIQNQYKYQEYDLLAIKPCCLSGISPIQAWSNWFRVLYNLFKKYHLKQFGSCRYSLKLLCLSQRRCTITITSIYLEVLPKIKTKI